MLPPAYQVLFHGRQDYSSVADFRDTSELLWPKSIEQSQNKIINISIVKPDYTTVAMSQ